MSLRTPRHDFGPSSSTSRYGVSNPYATPRSANPYGAASLMETPGNATINNALTSSASGVLPPQPHQFDFLSHPLFSDPESEAANGGYLQFTGLYSQMANFKAQLDGFVEESIRRVQHAADTHSEIKEEYRKATKEFERDVEVEKKAQHELFTKIASEREEDAEARRVQADKERSVHSLTAQLSDVQNELSEMKRDLANRREERQHVASKLKEMTRLDVPERKMLETRTGCRIDTPGDDLVSFTFTLLDPKYPTQEAFFVFALSKRAYTVPIVEPAVPHAVLQPLIQELNRSRNAFKFIKQIRSILKDQVVGGATAKMSLQEAVDAANLAA